jgi:hypothetical protein
MPGAAHLAHPPLASIIRGHGIGLDNSQAESMTTQFAPILTAPLSALTTAPKPIEVLAPIDTSPQIVAFGAMRADGSMAGRFPLCSRIIGVPFPWGG